MGGAPPDLMHSPGPSTAVEENAAHTATAASRRPRVLFISADPVGEEMAGLGIRYWELARTLRGCGEVTVAHGGSEQGETDGLRLAAYRPHAPAALRPLIAAADMVVTHPQWPIVTSWLRHSGVRTVFDLYDPETLETLELLSPTRPRLRRAMTTLTLDRLHASLHTGHHFMCATEAQRDLWLGAMLGLRLIGPRLYDGDPTLRSLIDTVPFGLPAAPPTPSGAGPPQSIPLVGESAELVLWNGGIWSWLDAPTAIRAVAELAVRRPRLRLVFMGASHQQAAIRAAAEARELADRLGVLNRSVIFHDRWVAYAERAAWLTQADCAVSTHRDHLEARFAFRTRLLDCFWAGVPVVCTSGDALAERVVREDLGAVVPAGDHRALAAALAEVLDRGRRAFAPQLSRIAGEYVWERVAEPLQGWLASPLPPQRAGETPGALRAPLAQSARASLYRLAAHHFLARRRR